VLAIEVATDRRGSSAGPSNWAVDGVDDPGEFCAYEKRLAKIKAMTPNVAGIRKSDACLFLSLG
jgi:hypothetical protein